MNVEIGARRRTILRLKNDGIASRLQPIWKEMEDNAQLQNQKMIEWQVDCNECGNRCKKTHNLKIHKWSDKESIAIIMKEMQENAQFQNKKKIEWQVDCNECGNRCKKTHNLKIHKWSEDKPIAMNVEWIAGQRTILRLENNRIASRLQ